MQTLKFITIFVAVVMMLHVGIASLITHIKWKDKDINYANKYKMPAYLYLNGGLLLGILSCVIVNTKIEDIIYIICSIIIGYIIGGYYRKYL
jgi:hypothetical protein